MEDPLLSKARDPQTTPEELSELATHQKLQRAVASNPNIPKHTLLQLAAEHPGEILQNPALSIFLLEDPSLLTQLSSAALLAMLKHESASQPILQEAWCRRTKPTEFISQAHYSRGLASSPQTPPEFLEQLCFDHDPETKKLALQHPTTPKRFVSAIQRLGVSPDFVTYSSLYDPSLPTEEIEFAYRPGNYLLSEMCARHPNTPEAMLRAMAPNPYLSSFLLQNPSLPEDLLLPFLDNNKEDVKAAALEHPRCPVSVLERFATHPHLWYRAAVAKNPSTPAPVLQRLIKDKDCLVRQRLAANRAAPLSLLLLLAKDPQIVVRRALAHRAHLPDELRDILTKDKEAKVRAVIKKGTRRKAPLKKRRA